MRLRAAAIAATAVAAIGGAYVTGRVHGAAGASPATTPATTALAATQPTAAAPAAPATANDAAVTTPVAGTVRPPTLVEPVWTEGVLGAPPAASSLADAPASFAPAADAPAPQPDGDESAPPPAPPTVPPPPPPVIVQQQPVIVQQQPVVIVQPPPVGDDGAWAPAEESYVVVREYYGCSANEALLIPSYCRTYGIVDADAYCLLQIARSSNRPFTVVFDDWYGRCHRDYNVLLSGYGLTPEIFIVDPDGATWWPSVYDRPFACWRQHRWTGVAFTADEYRALVSYRIAVEYQGLPPARFFLACRSAPAPVVVVHNERDRFGDGGRDWRGQPLRIHSERPWRMPERDRDAWRSGAAETQRAQVAHLAPPTVARGGAPTRTHAATGPAPTPAAPVVARPPASGAVTVTHDGGTARVTRPEPSAPTGGVVREPSSPRATRPEQRDPTSPRATRPEQPAPASGLAGEPTPPRVVRPEPTTPAPSPAHVPSAEFGGHASSAADTGARATFTHDHGNDPRPSGDDATTAQRPTTIHPEPATAPTAPPTTRPEPPTAHVAPPTIRPEPPTARVAAPTPAPTVVHVPSSDGGHASSAADTGARASTSHDRGNNPRSSSDDSGASARLPAATRPEQPSARSESAVPHHEAPARVESAPRATPAPTADRHVDEYRVERPSSSNHVSPPPSAAAHDRDHDGDGDGAHGRGGR